MSRYLLYDAGCSTCTGLARSVERETGSWLSARSLRDPDMQKYLQSAKSNWNWEPTLLVINGANVKVYTGKSMAVYMLLGLGVRKSLRITHLVRQATQGNHPQIQGVDRRAILVRAASIVGGTTLAGLFGVGKVAASPMLREDAADWQLMKPHEVAQYSSLILDSNEGQQCEAFLSSQGFQPTPSLSAGTIITYMDEQSFSLEIGYRLNDTTQGRIVGAGRSGSIERVSVNILQYEGDQLTHGNAWQLVGGNLTLSGEIAMKYSSHTAVVTNHVSHEQGTVDMLAIASQASVKSPQPYAYVGPGGGGAPCDCSQCLASATAVQNVLLCGFGATQACALCALLPPGLDFCCAGICIVASVVICNWLPGAVACQICKQTGCCSSC